jgi:hypothetical protein
VGLAAISPDGKYVVHVVVEPAQQSLWMRQVATSSNVQIVAPTPVRYDGLTFSPDGKFVYYSTCAWRIRMLTRQRAFDKALDNASANDMKPCLWTPVG